MDCMEATMKTADPATTTANQRRHPRVALPAGYAAVRVRREGQRRFALTGHAYDLSEGGVR